MRIVDHAANDAENARRRHVVEDGRPGVVHADGGKNSGLAPNAVGGGVSITREEVKRAFEDQDLHE